MKKQFYLEGERITLKRAKAIFGEERYHRIMREAKASYIADPLVEIAYHTSHGIVTIWLQLD